MSVTGRVIRSDTVAKDILMLTVKVDVWIEVVNIPISTSEYLLHQIRILAIRGSRSDRGGDDTWRSECLLLHWDCELDPPFKKLS